jgi:hypothetical protein
MKKKVTNEIFIMEAHHVKPMDHTAVSKNGTCGKSQKSGKVPPISTRKTESKTGISHN